MSYKIQVDVSSAVSDFFPALSNSEVDLIAKNISENWDYSPMYQEVYDNIKSYATFNKIDLDGKDGIIEEENDNIYIVNSQPNSKLFP
jgi:hypothetical protein